MEERTLTAERIAAYGRYLRAEERAPATVEKYLRDVERFAAWLGGEAVTKEAVAEWKERPVHRQRGAGRPERPVPLSRLGRPGQVPESPAADVPGFFPGVDAGRL